MTERLRERYFFFGEEWSLCLERILIKAHVLHFHQNFFPLLTSLQSPSSLPPCLPPAPFLLIFPFLSSSHFSLFPFLSSFPPPPLLPRFRTLLCFSSPFPSRSVPSQFVTPLGNKDQVIFNDPSFLHSFQAYDQQISADRRAVSLQQSSLMFATGAFTGPAATATTNSKYINCESQKRLWIQTISSFSFTETQAPDMNPKPTCFTKSAKTTVKVEHSSHLHADIYYDQILRPATSRCLWTHRRRLTARTSSWRRREKSRVGAAL